MKVHHLPPTNWRRVGIFVLICVVATAAAAFPFGFISGFSAARGEVPAHWLPIGQAIAVVGSGIVVTCMLVRKLSSRPWIHAWAMGLSVWLLSYPINVLGFRAPVSAWIAGLPSVCVMVIIGVPLGLLFKSSIGIDSAEKKPPDTH
jgi:hypothetical protein